MELGATVCTRSNPDCLRCPVRSLCRAYGEAHSPPPEIEIENCCEICAADDELDDRDVTRFPLTKVKAKPRLETVRVCCVESEQGFLLIKRHDKAFCSFFGIRAVQFG